MKFTTPITTLLSAHLLDSYTLARGWLGRSLGNANTRTNGFLFGYLQGRISKNLRAVINGVLGDALAVAGHPLAIPMTFKINGQPLTLERQALTSAIPEIHTKLVVLVHGICMSDLQWPRSSADSLQGGVEHAFVPQGSTCVCLHYNSGCHISTNGQEFSALLATLVNQWPIPVTDIVIVGSSLGGLVARSACHYGAIEGHHWLQCLSRLIFVGTPHHGSPLERRGNWVDTILSSNRCTSQLARLAKIRSAAITDLRYGNLLDSDWQGCDRFEPRADSRQPVALPTGVVCYTLAATMGKREGDFSDRLMGDGLVPLNSALGYHSKAEFCLSFSQFNQWVGYSMHHLELLSHPNVYAQIKIWLTSPIASQLDAAN